MKNFVEDFKKFAMKGNVVDLAVAVIIGAAFGKIVSSLVDNVIMPLIGILVGGIDFSDLVINVQDATITYGVFIQSVIDFLIIALVIFMVIRALAKLEKKADEKPAEPSEEVKLLRDIRDNLRR
jgi:large conductance mechanosensitive channel